MYRKTRKSLLHMKLSNNDNFIHDHELYEMMRSRQLYNVHNDLRKELGRTIRSIQKAERDRVANIEAQRLLFLQRAARKAKERLKLTQVPRNLFDADDDNIGSGPHSTVRLVKLSQSVTGDNADGDKFQSQSMYEGSSRIYEHCGARVSYKHLPQFPDIVLKTGSNVLRREETIPALTAHQSVRISRLLEIRQYSQILYRRVRDFKL